MEEGRVSGNNVHLGRNIRRIREIKSISQKDLATALSVRQQKISKVELAEIVDESLLIRIAEVLEVTADYIRNFNPDEVISHYSSYQPVTYSFDSIDKIIELYERLLKNEKDKNKMLMMLNRLHEKQ